MNIYPVLAGIRQEFPRDARWRCIWQKRSTPGGIFYESFVTFPWPPATHPLLPSRPRTPVSRGLFPINMHYAATDKRSQRPAVAL